ncbi:MAG TPA: rhodanese-like domain-containing protein [Gammaproteobacteria bacterium]|nr:rhodanese-like domain-containing protein [Gammaproteobacteria bacterium]
MTDPAFNSFSRAAAGSLGQVGLEAGMFSRGTLFSRVLIVSDEFVNPFGQAAAVTSNFIIDGGLLVDSFSRDARLIFSLLVGAEHVGVTGEEPDEGPLLTSGALAAGLGGAGGFFDGFFGGSYIFIIETDSVGTRSIVEEIAGGLDLGITQINGTEFEIPFSLQSLDLGIVGPGERLLLGYDLAVRILVDGVTEGTFASFSDPFVLDGDPIRTSVTFTEATTTAVPEPGTLPLLSAALLLLGLAVANGKRLVFYCAYVERSAMAVQTALETGLRNSCHIKGGLDAWKKVDGPEESAS